MHCKIGFPLQRLLNLVVEVISVKGSVLQKTTFLFTAGLSPHLQG